MRLTWTGVWVDNRNAFLTGAALEETLLSTVVARTCETSKVEQNRDLLSGLGGGLWWEVEVELHLAIRRCCLVGKLEELAAERGNGSCSFERHTGLNLTKVRWMCQETELRVRDAVRSIR